MEDNKNHILIVDDDDKIRNLLKNYLIENQYIISTAEDAEQAKERLKIIKFDIIILDVMMPRKDGFSLAQDIRSTNKEVPIIFLTAKTMKEDVLKGYKVGADDYLKKPFDSDVLLFKIISIFKIQLIILALKVEVSHIFLLYFEFFIIQM